MDDTAFLRRCVCISSKDLKPRDFSSHYDRHVYQFCVEEWMNYFQRPL